MKNVTVYGPGCKRCETPEAMVGDAESRPGVEVEVVKVIDANSIAMAGVMSAPGVSVDGRLVHAGGLPDAAKLDNWLSA
ncbi:thioredoxin family protein [Halovulum dunhuangense]|uniref:Thioredoxin family protein n=1 Tax=Halovulum dunhuangense TaxID=1505036 RepID=A0A849L6G9_9RHOB|nr:thioredoxin family protein [Halovulum dunhuangense]NNU81677.1 thioredoxin family protein [Halovulum dunhuangense]